MDLTADRNGEHPSSLQNGPGPHLLHRGSTAADSHSNTSRSVALIDPDASGQGGKSENGKQAVQQSATAALGIYRRVSGVDRH